MPEPKLNFPQDAALAISILRRFTEWLATEKARTGMTEEQIIANYEEGFDANSADLAQFLKELRGEDIPFD